MTRPVFHFRPFPLLLIAAATLVFSCKQKAAPRSTTKPTTSTAPATTQAAAPQPQTYMDILHLRYPHLATTQPLDTPLDLADAGHFIIDDPVLLDSRGDLWIWHPNAPETQPQLANAFEHQTHIVRDHVVFVHWHVNDYHKWEPLLITRSASGNLQVVTPDSRRPLHATTQPSQPSTGALVYDFSRAQSWGDDKIIVPTDRGISIFTINPNWSESHLDLVPHPTGNSPQFTFDAEGILAWIPWENGREGSRGAARFVDGHWIMLNSKPNWPDKLVHLVPLLDGSVLQLIAASTDTIMLNLVPLSTGGIDESKIKDLVAQMSDPDPDKRKHAFEELQRYGNASWPVLEKLEKHQPPEARIRIRQLLANRIQPTLGGRTLVDSKARVVARLIDGGIVLYAPSGVSIPQNDGTNTVINPAWISIRPGQPIQLLDDALVRDADPDKDQLYAFSDEWVLCNADQGPERFEGNHLQPLVKEKELAYGQFVGIDRRGRWLFRKPASDSTTAPSTQSADHPTLIIDTTVPDPTPRLPIWVLNVKEGVVGWDDQDRPVIKRPGAWVLTETGWAALDEKKMPIRTAPPAPTNLPSTLPSTRQAASRPATQPLLIDNQGRAFYDGTLNLIVIDKAGHKLVWPLPHQAQGTIPPWLVESKSGKLFLYNSPGRIHRIAANVPKKQSAAQPSTSQPQPFVLEATFTHRIPNIEKPTRIWIDPFNRMIMLYDTHMAIMFPQGRIPPAIAKLIPAAELEDQEP